MESGNLKKKDLYVVRTRLLQKKDIKNTSKKYFMDKSFFIQTIILYLSMASLYGVVEKSCSLETDRPLIYAIAGVFCILFSLYYYFEKNNNIIFASAIVLQTALILIFSDMFKNGCISLINDIIKQLNSTYNGTIELLKGENTGREYVILCIFFWLIWFTAKGMVSLGEALHFVFIAFPIVLLSVLVGGSVSKTYIITLLISIQCMFVWSGIRIRKKFWGGLKSKEYAENKKVYGRVNSEAIIFFAAMIIASGSLAYIINSYTIKSLTALSDRVSVIKTEGIHFLQDFIPNISNGKLSFTVDGVGGGGTGGVLGELSGTYYSKTETLKLTCTDMPAETVYLKGYIGEIYTGRKWLEGDEEKFLESVNNPNIKDNVSLYIQNLPFLRMIYALNDAKKESDIKPSYITVERYGDVLSYTYVPYQAYLNENYRIQGGDGAVAAQVNYDDTYGWFEKDVYKEIINEWNNNDDKYSVLDEVEKEYENYVMTYDTKIGDTDLSGLSELCRDKKNEWDNKFKEGMTKQQIEDMTEEKYEDVKNFIIRTLWEKCTFKDEAKKLPKGKDYINYFMFDIKEGDSTAFASTAVMMFRIFGIPARYVEGYAAPTYLFSNNGENEYTAVLQDDNAHAWAEIYIPGVGWQYVETTPGFDGKIDNMEMPEENTNKENNNETEKTNDDKKIKKELSVSKKICNWFRSETLIIILCIIFGVIAFVVRCMIKKKYRRGIFRSVSNREKVKRIFYSYYEVLIFTGFSTGTDVATPEFIQEILKWDSSIRLWEIKKYQEIVLKAHFGKDEISDKEVAFSLRMYEKEVEDGRKKISFIKRIVYDYLRAF